QAAQQGVTAAEADGLFDEALSPACAVADGVEGAPQPVAAAAVPFVEEGLAELVASPEDAARGAQISAGRASAALRPARSPLPVSPITPAFAAAAPLAVLVVGWSAAAWLWTAQSNPILAGIAAAATAVGALLSRLLLRG
ncbi:MAG: hypothetical protein VXY92_14645, partial [Planctomycetota bacterium]|nr:hypothetical protein [Planctomycetota bacterium]